MRRMPWLFVVGALVVVSCSSGGPDSPPTLDRIDGPAYVDPSYDPFAVDSTPSTPSTPVVTEADRADG